jgi:hypothetical protein
MGLHSLLQTCVLSTARAAAGLGARRGVAVMRTSLSVSFSGLSSSIAGWRRVCFTVGVDAKTSVWVWWRVVNALGLLTVYAASAMVLVPSASARMAKAGREVSGRLSLLGENKVVSS